MRPIPKSTQAAREVRKGGKKQRKAQPKEQRRPEKQRRPLDDAAAVLRSAATFGVMRPLPILQRSVVRAGLFSRLATGSIFSPFRYELYIEGNSFPSVSFSRFRYELYIKGRHI